MEEERDPPALLELALMLEHKDRNLVGEAKLQEKEHGEHDDHEHVDEHRLGLNGGYTLESQQRTLRLERVTIQHCHVPMDLATLNHAESHLVVMPARPATGHATDLAR